MANQQSNNVKLGIFVSAGLLVLMLAFYMIGKSSSMFGGGFELKARFANLNGLMEGNNVLFSGIQAGTVKNIELVNDTTIEVTLRIDSKVVSFIHKNAVAAIGTEGLMGNKVVNILPLKTAAPNVTDGDLLTAQPMVNTDEMLQTLYKTNNNIASISEALKVAVLSIDSSAIFEVLNDRSIGKSLKSSLGNINEASVNAYKMTKSLNTMIAQIEQGKGTAGILLTDTSFARDLKITMASIRSAGDNANKMTLGMNELVTGINRDMNTGKGTLQALLRDSIMAQNIALSLYNIQQGTDGFNYNMEAIKHSFLLRGYFRKQEKLKREVAIKK